MTTDEAALAACAAAVRQADPDRYFSALFAPAPLRPLLFALYALNHEIARVAENVREPMLGEIRLQWWRETLEGARQGRPRAHDVAMAMAAVFARIDLPQAQLDAMIDAHAFDFSPEEFADFGALETYLDATSANLMRMACRILGTGDETDAVREAGLAYGLAGVARALPFHVKRRKHYMPRDLLSGAGLTAEEVFSGHAGARLAPVIEQVIARALEHHMAPRRQHIPNESFAAFLPAALVPLYASRLSRARFDPFRAGDVALYRRQLRLLSAALRGRI